MSKLIFKTKEEARAAMRPGYKDRIHYDEWMGHGWYVFKGKKKEKTD